MRRHIFNPNRTKPRTASERRHRRMVGGVLRMLKREIRQDRKKGEGK
jgi:hypothetical protein